MMQDIQDRTLDLELLKLAWRLAGRFRDALLRYFTFGLTTDLLTLK